MRMKEMYRSGAHYIEGRPPHTVPLDIVQHRFNKLLEKGEPLAGRDLAGVDLSGLDFDFGGTDEELWHSGFSDPSRVVISELSFDFTYSGATDLTGHWFI